MKKTGLIIIFICLVQLGFSAPSQDFWLGFSLGFATGAGSGYYAGKNLGVTNNITISNDMKKQILKIMEENNGKFN